MDNVGVERREGGSKRMTVDRPVAVFAQGREGIIRAHTRDLSTGGMRLDIGRGFDVGEKVLFKIDLGEGFDPAVQGGRVVWTGEEVGTGLVFEKVTQPESADGVASGLAGKDVRVFLPNPGDGVKLRIDKMDHALKVKCVTAAPEGVVLRTELPFLERGRSVKASFGSTDGTNEFLEGVLTRVLMDDDSGEGAPSILLEVRTDGRKDPLIREARRQEVESALAAAPAPAPAHVAPRAPAATPSGGIDASTVEQPQEWQVEEPTSPDAAIGKADPDRDPDEVVQEDPDSDPEPEATAAPALEAAPAVATAAASVPASATRTDLSDDDDDDAGAGADADEDAMSRAFESAGARSDAVPEIPIEPRYVIVLRAIAFWMVAAGRKAAALSVVYGRKAWNRALPWIRKTLPMVMALIGRLPGIARDLAGRLPILGRRGKAQASAISAPRTTCVTATRLRKQKPRASKVEGAAASSPLLKSRIFLAALALAAAAGFGTGIWGLVSLVTSGEEGDPSGASAVQPVKQAGGSFDAWGGATLPAGNVAEVGDSDIQVVAAAAPVQALPAQPAAPMPPTQAYAIQGGPAPAPAIAAAIAPAAPPAAAAAQPVMSADAGGSVGFKLPVKGEVTGYNHYALKDPVGLVIDVKGASPASEGPIDVEIAGVRSVKALSRPDGARFILYFEGTALPDYQVLPAGSTLEVRFD